MEASIADLLLKMLVDCLSLWVHYFPNHRPGTSI